MHYHPWRGIRLLPSWRVIYRDLDDEYGFTHRPSKTIVLARDLDQAERRCTLAHELEHIAAGHHGCQPSSVERAIEQQTARRLIPIAHLVDAMLWVQHNHDRHELASDLWVDLPTLDVRLDNLTTAEHTEILRRLDALEPMLRRSA